LSTVYPVTQRNPARAKIKRYENRKIPGFLNIRTNRVMMDPITVKGKISFIRKKACSGMRENLMPLAAS
jgi:hypothetical protein